MLCAKPYVKDGQSIIGMDFDPSRRELLMNKTLFPCGQCINCRIYLGSMWKTRLILEASSHESSVFVTLTHNPESRPKDNSVSKEIAQKFLKRLRILIEPRKVRYFLLGEYGSEEYSMHPHYHAIFFGMTTLDKYWIYKAWNQVEPLSIDVKGNYKHPEEKGYITVSEFSDSRAGYITGYTTSKLYKNRDMAKEMGLKEEFVIMSRKPGLGLEAAIRIAEGYKKNPEYDGRIIDSITLGVKKFPLGRYLTTKIAEHLGTDVSLFERRLEDYQKELFTTANIGNDDKTRSFYDEILAKNRPKRDRMQNKHKRYGRRQHKLSEKEERKENETFKIFAKPLQAYNRKHGLANANNVVRGAPWRFHPAKDKSAN